MATAPVRLRHDSTDPRALVLWTVAVVAAAVLVAWILFLVRQTLLLIYVSSLLAIGFSPLVRLIEGQRLVPLARRLPRWFAILVVYLAILGVLAAIASIALPPLLTQAREFATHLPQLLDDSQRYLVRRGLLTEAKSVGEIVQHAPAGTDVVGTLFLTFWGLIGGVFGLVTILILTFYLLIDAEGVIGSILGLFPRRWRRELQAAAREITNKVSGWLNGQLMLAGCIGTSTAIGLGSLGIPYFYVLAVIAAVGEMIPYVGPLLSALPGIAVAFTMSWKLALTVALFYFLQQQIEANLLMPKVMERQVGLSPVAILIALLIGGSLLGVAGAVLAVPTAAILRVVLEHVLPEEPA